MKDPIERFSDRVDSYVRYRPAYPDALVDRLIAACRLDGGSVVADIGSGTGIFTRQLLDRHLRVVGVEPNRQMRQAAESLLRGYGRFTSVNGRAESSNLAERSIDLIVVAQAFHWFRRDAAKEEFVRILKPGSCVALIWNRRKAGQAFQRDYEALLREHAPEYDRVNHMNATDRELAEFFAPNGYQMEVFVNSQVFDRDGFLGRMQSVSYIPSPDSPGYSTVMAAAEQLFAKYAHRGRVTFEYDTRMYLGRFVSGGRLGAAPARNE
jgi:SAM-dependent methyltransferase